MEETRGKVPDHQHQTAEEESEDKSEAPLFVAAHQTKGGATEEHCWRFTCKMDSRCLHIFPSSSSSSSCHHSKSPFTVKAPLLSHTDPWPSRLLEAVGRCGLSTTVVSCCLGLSAEPSHLVDTHSHSDQADNTRPSSSPDKSSKEGEQFHGREPSAKLLFLDISSCSVQLQVFDQNGVGENGSGYGGGGGKGREGWAGAGPQALVEELCLGVRVAPGVSPEAQQLYQCSLCERPFSQRGSLNRHVRSHLGVRPYLCPRCPMTFSRQYRVTEHMRVHERCVLREDHLKVSRSPET
ncbi:hypothetical protein CRUP_005119 [Coryphaenoides rupestris]|nr:hypothetical protein CRUP_005119 [Coryphaenoides rupestris]